MKSITLQAGSIKEIKNKIDDAISGDFKPSLAIIFADMAFNFEELSKLFQDNEISIFGSSCGYQIDGDEIFQQSIVTMLLDINKNDFNLYYEETKNNNTYEIATNAARYAKETYENPAMLVVTASVNTDGVSIVEGINNEMERNIPCYGGMAAYSDMTNPTNYIFTNNKYTDFGALFLIIDNDKVEVNGMASGGWESVGIEKNITKAEGNIIYTIDDQPAYDTFAKYYNTEEDLWRFPLQIIEEGKRPVLRAAMFPNKENQSLVFGARIPENAKVKFSILPSFEIIDKTIEDAKDLHAIATKADAIIMFSCGARMMTFGPLMEDEVKGIKDIWGAPLAGFFTSGEYGNNISEATNFHNQTCILTVLKEK
ncbi:FIST signal transduction protein [Bacteroidota bacterium]